MTILPLYNIRTQYGDLMLGCHAPYEEAIRWLEHYRKNYPVGMQYPNKRGRYPNFQFHLVIMEEGDGDTVH